MLRWVPNQHGQMEAEPTSKAHGVARVIDYFGGVHEATFKRGAYHGLDRWIWPNGIEIRLFKQGAMLAFIKFDSNFNETERGGFQSDLLNDIGPATFKA